MTRRENLPRLLSHLGRTEYLIPGCVEIVKVPWSYSHFTNVGMKTQRANKTCLGHTVAEQNQNPGLMVLSFLN